MNSRVNSEWKVHKQAQRHTHQSVQEVYKSDILGVVEVLVSSLVPGGEVWWVLGCSTRMWLAN